MGFTVIPYSQLSAALVAPRKKEMVSYPKRWRKQPGVDLGLPKKTADPIKFNPCISLLKRKRRSCVYAMAYRALVPRGAGFGKRSATPRRKAKIRGKNVTVGIWDSGFNNYWDGTGMARIEIFDDGAIQVLSDSLHNKGAKLFDPRLIKHRSKHYLQYSDYLWNQQGWDVKSDSRKPLQKCSDTWKTCILIGMVEVEIPATGGGYKFVGGGKIICQDQSQHIEKNWAYVPRTKLTMQYGMGPMEYLTSAAGKPSAMVACDRYRPPGAAGSTFVRLQGHLGNAIGPHHAIACTSPLQHFDANSYIGLGHVKVQFKNYNANLAATSNIHRFMREVAVAQGVEKRKPSTWFKNGLDLHHDFIYLMFMYTVDKKTLQLKSFSDGILPQSSQIGYFMTLVFPVAIEPFAPTGSGKVARSSPTNFALSLGLSDHDCAIWTMSKRELSARLVHSPKSFKPENFDFRITHL